MKKFLKKIILKLQRLIFLIINYTGVNFISRIINQNKLLVLTYHNFKNDEAAIKWNPYDNKCTGIEKFKQQLNYLKKKYHFITIDDLLLAIEHKLRLPKNSLLITIDDGYESNYTLVFPVLKLLNIPVVIFIVTSFIENKIPLWTDRLDHSLNSTGKPVLNIEKSKFDLTTTKNKILSAHLIRKLLKKFTSEKLFTTITKIEKQLEAPPYNDLTKEKKYRPLSWEQITEMSNSGLVTIGGHTDSHPYLSALNSEQQDQEIARSKKIIEDKTKKPCKIFAYPFGDKGSYNTKTQKILKKNGFIAAFTTLHGHFNLSKNSLKIKRVSIDDRDQDEIDLVGKITFGRII